MDSWGVLIRTWNWRLGISVRGPYPRWQILGGKQSVNGISKLRFGGHGGVFFGGILCYSRSGDDPTERFSQIWLLEATYESNFLKNASFHIFG